MSTRWFPQVLACSLMLVFSLPHVQAEVVLTLEDGTRLRADAVSTSKDGRTVVLKVERVGIVMTRVVDSSRVSQVERGGRVVPTRNEMPVAALQTVNLGTHQTNSAGGVPAGRACGRPHVAYVSQGTKTRGVVISIRRDPLWTYGRMLDATFPDGVAQSESGFIRELMRAHISDELSGAKRPNRGVLPPAGVPLPAGPLQRVSVDARAVSSRGKVDWDSLSVSIAGFDQKGRPVRPSGSARITLWGQTERPVRTIGDEVVLFPDRIEKLESWTVPITADAIVGSSARVVVPFSQPSPDHSTKVFPLGELHVELTVPGSGVFEASRSGILLSHQSELRRRLTETTGARFFPGEGTSESKAVERPLTVRQTELWPGRRILSIKP